MHGIDHPDPLPAAELTLAGPPGAEAQLPTATAGDTGVQHEQGCPAGSTDHPRGAGLTTAAATLHQ